MVQMNPWTEREKRRRQNKCTDTKGNGAGTYWTLGLTHTRD